MKTIKKIRKKKKKRAKNKKNKNPIINPKIVKTMKKKLNQTFLLDLNFHKKIILVHLRYLDFLN